MFMCSLSLQLSSGKVVSTVIGCPSRGLPNKSSPCSGSLGGPETWKYDLHHFLLNQKFGKRIKHILVKNSVHWYWPLMTISLSYVVWTGVSCCVMEMFAGSHPCLCMFCEVFMVHFFVLLGFADNISSPTNCWIAADGLEDAVTQTQ